MNWNVREMTVLFPVKRDLDAPLPPCYPFPLIQVQIRTVEHGFKIKTPKVAGLSVDTIRVSVYWEFDGTNVTGSFYHSV